MKEIVDEFTAGFGIAMVELIKLHFEDSMAADVCRECGMSYEKFENSGLEEEDLKILKEALS